MKALFEHNGQPGKIEGPAYGVLHRLEKLAKEPSFVAHKLFAAESEMPAVAEFDQVSDVLDDFNMILDEESPTFNSQRGYVSNITYQPAKEGNVQTNFERGTGLETTDGGALDVPGLFDDMNMNEVEGDISYRGAIGHNSDDPLDLPTMNWDEPKSTGKKNAGVRRLSGDDAPLDLPGLF